MFHIIYLSSAAAPFTKLELQKLLMKSRQNNEAKGITGILFHKDGNFLQAIEGEESAVKNLYAKISQDRRHHGMMVLFDEEIAEREFLNWSMAFRDLSNPSEQIPEGFNDILNTEWSKMELTSYSAKIRAFMKMFAH